MSEITLDAIQTLVVAIIAYFLGRVLVKKLGYWTDFVSLRLSSAELWWPSG